MRERKQIFSNRPYKAGSTVNDLKSRFDLSGLTKQVDLWL